MIATLQSSVRKMNDLLLRLSPDAARPSEPPRAVLLEPLLEGVAAAKRRAHPVLVEGDAALAALVDPGSLEQALVHLVQNAIDASPADSPVRLSHFESGGDVAIEIADAGPGMSSEFIATQLFQPFASTKTTGFGIGAYEARALIQAMGGRLEVESAEGRGTCFTLFLPGAEIAAPALQRMRA
jgi:signal transduction histidine kinase